MGTVDPYEVLSTITSMAERYGIELQKPSNVDTASVKLDTELRGKVTAIEPTQQRHVLLKQILDEDLEGKRQKVKEARAKALKTFDHQIEVLIQAGRITRETPNASQEIACPACGKPIYLQDLQAHIDAELNRMQEARERRDKARTAESEYVEAINHALIVLKSEYLKDWLSDKSNVETLNAFNLLDEAQLPNDMNEWSVELSETVDSALNDILRSVRKSTFAAPPPTQQLLEDLGVVEMAKSLKEIEVQSRVLASVKRLTQELETGEEDVRHYIRSQVEAIISKCSSEVQRLWSTLHPNEPIEDIRLTSSEDKAVDVELKFFGKPQGSPRLTLSEGHRNSLSLCIFLALAGLAKAKDDPIVLDDIVSSLDRRSPGADN